MVVAPDFKYTVQVASYADEKFARRVADDLGKKGFGKRLSCKRQICHPLCGQVQPEERSGGHDRQVEIKI